MYLKLLLITSGVVLIAFVLLALRTIILKDGRFPNTSVSGNKKLRQMGIVCAKCEEQARFNRIMKYRKKTKIDPSDLTLATD